MTEGRELFPCVLAEDVRSVTPETAEAVQGEEGTAGLFLGKVRGPRDCGVITVGEKGESV